MNRNVLSAGGLALAAILFVAVNVTAMNWLRGAQVDLTDNALYTLSDGSRRVLSSIPEPITFRFYFSERLGNDLPQIKAYADRVRELLDRYALASDGMIRLVRIDPEPFTDAEDDAVRAGLQPVPVGGGENLYFGLVGTNMVDDDEVIPFFSQEKEPFLEYDLTSIVHNLSHPQRPTVGIITAHQMNAFVTPMMEFSGSGPKPWAIVPVLREAFEVKNVEPSERYLPDGLDVLLVEHPAGLNDSLKYEIDQFVMRGGRAVVFVDPYSEVAQAFGGGGQMQARTPTESDLDPVLAAWGVELIDDKVVGDWATAQQVNAGARGQPRIVRYLPWMELGPENYVQDDVVTAGLGPIVMITAGALAPVEGATTTFEPLIRSTGQAMLFEARDVSGGPRPDVLIEQFEATGENYVMAARLTGPARSAYPDGRPAFPDADRTIPPREQELKDAAEKRGHLVESAGPINVIVVADSDLLYDQFWQQSQDLFGKTITIPTASNAALAMNALDNLSGTSDLIGLRSRGQSNRPFTVVEGLRRTAEQRFLEEEKRLQATLQETQRRLNGLQGRAAAGGGALLSDEQQAEIAGAREEILATRKQLRDVQHNLNRDIERLEARIKFANIALVPIVVALLALALAALGYQRRRRRSAGRA